MKMKDFAGSGVDQRQVPQKCFRENPRKVSSFRIKLTEQTVAVFVGSFLPSTIRIGEVNVAVQFFLNSLPVGKLGAAVAGNRLYQLIRKCGKHFHESSSHSIRFSVRYFHRQIQACFALGKSSKARFAFPLSAHNRVRFPMSGFFSGINTFVAFSDRLPGIEFTAFFFVQMTFPFAAKDFQIAIQKIFLI